MVSYPLTPLLRSSLVQKIMSPEKTGQPAFAEPSARKSTRCPAEAANAADSCVFLFSKHLFCRSVSDDKENEQDKEELFQLEKAELQASL